MSDQGDGDNDNDNDNDIAHLYNLAWPFLLRNRTHPRVNILALSSSNASNNHSR